MKRIHKFNRNAARQLAGCMEQPLAVSWKMLHEQQQQEGPSAPPKKSIEDQLSDALSERDGLKSQVTDLTKERDTARNELKDSKAEVKRLTEQFDTLTKTADSAKADVTRLTGELSSMTSERDTLKGKLTTADTNVSRLEKLCGLNGVDPASAVPAESSENVVDKRAALVNRLNKATDMTERAKIASQLRAYDAANKE